ncbi:MAG: hypothetical protein Unbinned202contig1002_37 [Prokaryotic dsDNA virus sp.]|nr:MAG: hypothetical protein Unbinned202contig1002_37 [Prokaryotic dsDNA virus sp.]|tara:strand:+ start:15981 stop:16742 length:762 start_codon:yes stop_codon:yes gene_type:complete
MAKRFIDTKIWDKAWFRRLTPKNKLIWIYLLTRCDHAGIWDADWEASEFFIGDYVSFDELPKEITSKMKYIDGEDQYFIPSFIDFQYGELKENSKPHLSVLKRLTEKGLHRVSNTLKDKDKVINKVKGKEEREIDFASNVKKKAKQIENISEEQVNNFIYYWTESNENGKKLKFEMQKTFDIKRRLMKWRNNDFEWSKNGKEKKSFESNFTKTPTGFYRAFCSRCGKKELPINKWQLKEGSSCCRVEYVTEKP